jgi:hypothetical protein
MPVSKKRKKKKRKKKEKYNKEVESRIEVTRGQERWREGIKKKGGYGALKYS